MYNDVNYTEKTEDSDVMGTFQLTCNNLILFIRDQLNNNVFLRHLRTKVNPLVSNYSIENFVYHVGCRFISVNII